MSKKYEVYFSVSGSVVIEAESESEARRIFSDSDFTPTIDIIEAIKNNIEDSGNDAIRIEDLCEISQG